MKLIKRFCQLCGYMGEGALETHHLNGDRSDNSVVNLLVVCGNCHGEIHAKKRRISKGQLDLVGVVQTISSPATNVPTPHGEKPFLIKQDTYASLPPLYQRGADLLIQRGEMMIVKEGDHGSP